MVARRGLQLAGVEAEAEGQHPQRLAAPAGLARRAEEGRGLLQGGRAGRVLALRRQHGAGDERPAARNDLRRRSVLQHGGDELLHPVVVAPRVGSRWPARRRARGTVASSRPARPAARSSSCRRAGARRAWSATRTTCRSARGRSCRTASGTVATVASSTGRPTSARSASERSASSAARSPGTLARASSSSAFASSPPSAYACGALGAPCRIEAPASRELLADAARQLVPAVVARRQRQAGAHELLEGAFARHRIDQRGRDERQVRELGRQDAGRRVEAGQGVVDERRQRPARAAQVGARGSRLAGQARGGQCGQRRPALARRVDRRLLGRARLLAEGGRQHRSDLGARERRAAPHRAGRLHRRRRPRRAVGVLPSTSTRASPGGRAPGRLRRRLRRPPGAAPRPARAAACGARPRRRRRSRTRPRRGRRP